MFKKVIVISLLLGSVVLTGCNKNKEEIELLKQQNALLQEQINQKPFNDNLFNKRQECNKYSNSLQQKHPTASISVFYSPYKNSCIYETIAIKDGTIVSRSISDIFSDTAYVIEQENLGGLLYNEKDFGKNKTYDQIKEILKE